MKLSRTSPAEG